MIFVLYNIVFQLFNEIKQNKRVNLKTLKVARAANFKFVSEGFHLLCFEKV